MSGLNLHFMGWNRPVLDWAVEELMKHLSGGVLDLTDQVILVPTAETARRLREKLAVKAAEHEGAVMAPHVWSPEAILTWDVDRQLLATSIQEQQIWLAVLNHFEVTDYPHLFPAVPVIDRWVWATGVADTLANLRRSTGAGGYSFAKVASKLALSEDADRWKELASLEALYLARLAEAGLEDTQVVKARAAQAARLPDGVKQVRAFALPDPPALVKEWLQGVANQVPVDVFVQAPKSEQSRFDAMGIPLLDAWIKDVPKLLLENDHLHLESHAEQQAHRAVKLVYGLALQKMETAVGLCDTSLSTHLVGALAAEDVNVYDPAGRSAGQHPLLDMLRTWHELAQSGLWRLVKVFLRQDDVITALAGAHEFKASELLNDLDRFYEEHLPATLDDAVLLSGQITGKERDAKLNKLLQQINQKAEEWRKADVTVALHAMLEWIYGTREFKTEGEHDREYALLLGVVMQLAEQAEGMTQQLGGKISTRETMPLVLRELESVSLPDPRGEVGIVLRGWLELLWEPAAGLVVCGFNDENVPGVMPVDPFLPDHVRESLDLACQRSRCARDAYLLTALVGQRSQQGALHLVLGQKGDNEDVLRPSRLLFACDDAGLPSRVSHLFPKDSEASSLQEPPHSMAWKLRPWKREGWPESVSPSLLKSYLRCPTRCYLEKGLKMEAVDASQKEMTLMDFGNLVHKVLHLFGRNEVLRDSFAFQEITRFFDDALLELARLQWGPTPLLSTSLQIETARQRLAHAARVQAELRKDGWRIIEVEYDLNPAKTFELGGLPFHARADRVDQHRDGRLRVLDYKTGSRGTGPEAAHIGSASPAMLENPDTMWKCFSGPKGGGKQWTDLQLPLYAWALQQRRPEATAIEVGYFQLPAAVTETRVDLWQINAESMENAMACAEVGAARLREGIFWPPTEDLRGDAFEELLFADPLASIEEPSMWKGGDHD